mmetsp:Transcript_32792/g.91846  ORF Transcript_32792/g.91846 Transcript_32792/m.91846 type:complete len:400 (+) Transcript_32792:100-1299(+)|eukprot:CAMPEP_0119121764 /NCGR_PEP_ID=MMETSP1310-20130426/2241_1 /TAXON_ID=464262 /ORGANISM="Genus nov. species nov., Strain RCC2339" /LENGTH=399 /DNA_ID=CAMNT_0007111341 /DNA_START=51 /DNA_END=1250 /DNA_ORIENTATION=+
MAAAGEVPLYITTPLRASEEEKERHMSRRKAKEAEVVPLLKSRLTDMGVRFDELHADKVGVDIALARFLRARRYEVDETAVMIRDYLKWRIDYGVEALVDESTHSSVLRALAKYYPGGYHGKDRNGIPVYFERAGLFDVPSLIREVPPEEAVRFHVYKNEKNARELMELSVARQGGQYLGRVFVIDLDGIGWNHIQKDAMSVLQAFIEVDQANFPEMLKRLFIIRAPAAFTAIWRLIKPWLDARTLAKIEICGYNDFLEPMLLEIPLEHIPKEYGGKCQCPGGCLKKAGGAFEGVHDGREKPLWVARQDSAEIVVTAPGNGKIDFSFRTDTYDVGFRLYFLPAGGRKRSLVKDYKKVEAFVAPVAGSFTKDTAGTWVFHFDNTYSWTRGKQVHYKIKLL